MMAFSLLAGTAGGSASAADEPVVLIETSLGNIKVKLYPDKTPLTVKNFLGYVDEKFYDNTIFHRVIGKENSRNDFMIQGGGIDVKTKAEKPTKAPVKNEADLGLPNRRGTIAMARTNVVDSATSQFFINVADNDFLNHTQKTREGYGYCAFGEVIEGMDVVDKIKAVKTTGDTGRNVPLEDVVIKSIRRVPAK
jgi:cyclophilin family peptidyl-prolyl cis-trans isomerase